MDLEQVRRHAISSRGIWEGLRGGICHAKTGVKSHETSGFYISIQPT